MGATRRCRAPLWRGADVRPLGRPDSRQGVVPGGSAGKPLACASVGKALSSGIGLCRLLLFAVGCLGKHYQSGTDNALPAAVVAVVAAVGSIGYVRLLLVRLLLQADGPDQRKAELQR
jgi:hypothetical protein